MARLILPFADPHSPMRTGVAGRCPRCGEGKFGAGLLKLAKRCGRCGLSYDFADPADGPAFFVMSATSFLSVGILFPLQAVFGMPDWLLMALIAAATLGLSIAMLIPIKGWLVNSQYFYKAGEGVLAEPVSSAPCGCANCAARYARKRAA